MKKVILILMLFCVTLNIFAQEEVSQSNVLSTNKQRLSLNNEYIYTALMCPTLERSYDAFGRYAYMTLPGILVGKEKVFKTYFNNKVGITFGGHLGFYTTFQTYAVEVFGLAQSKIYYQTSFSQGLSFYLSLGIGLCLRAGDMPKYQNYTLGNFIYDNTIGIRYNWKNGTGLYLDINPTPFIFLAKHEREVEAENHRRRERLEQGLENDLELDKAETCSYGYSYFNLGLSFRL